MVYRRETLPNGVRLITEAVPHVGSASIGIWVHAGSRWEVEPQAGISHFVEHMVFKGTEKRTARQIAEDLDAVGGRLNAFTDKEATCYYARVLGEHVPLALDVLTDMLLHSTLDEVELERERNVILEEIKQHEDDPEDLVHDLFARQIWPDHPLGRPVIGSPESVGAIGRGTLRAYLNQWYAPDRIIVAGSGQLDPDQVREIVHATLGQLPPSSHEVTPAEPVAVALDRRVHKETEQVNLCVGWPGIGQASEDRYALACLDTAFGGGMSSRLFQEIREERGLAYSIGSYFTSYHEGGLYTVFAGTSPETHDEVIEIVRREAASVRQSGLTMPELARAKNQIKGSLLMGLESMSNRMSRLGKTELYFGRVITVDEVVQRIEAVTLGDCHRVADQIFAQPGGLTAIGPFAEAA